MFITGNKGEWSEVYAFLRLLGDGKLFAADEQLNRIPGMFFPILKILREEVAGAPYEYCPDPAKAIVEIYLNDQQVLIMPAEAFENEATRLFEVIKARGAGNGSFEVADTESFIRSIYMTKLKAPSCEKSDINMQIHDVNTGYQKVVGFSIKSELGMPSTLLNAGKTTNFVFSVVGLDSRHVAEINAIETKRKIKDRIEAILGKGGRLVFQGMESRVFNNNLFMIDSQMPCIIAEMLIGYYSAIKADCAGLADYVSQKDPLSRSPDFYKHKIKEMLCAVALGMKPSTSWDGTDEASGGYIIVRTNGDVLAYHIYNRDAFRAYLLGNTKLESAGSNRHGYGELYQQGSATQIKLNLQIRFI